MVSEPKSPFNRPPETLLGHGVNFQQLSGMPFIAQPLPRSMSTLRMMRSLGEIENYRSQMEVPEVPKDPCLLLDMCTWQWNKLNKVQLAGAHTAGCGKEDRKAIHLWFHQIASPWCDRLGHTSPSTCLNFIVPEPETQYNKDTKHRMLEAWLAWVLVQQSEKEILAMIPDFMLFRRLLCKVYHTQGPEYHGPCRRSAAFGGGFRSAAAATGHMQTEQSLQAPCSVRATCSVQPDDEVDQLPRRGLVPWNLGQEPVETTDGVHARGLLLQLQAAREVHLRTNADERAVSKVSVRFFLYYYSPFRASTGWLA